MEQRDAVQVDGAEKRRAYYRARYERQMRDPEWLRAKRERERERVKEYLRRKASGETIPRRGAPKGTNYGGGRRRTFTYPIPYIRFNFKEIPMFGEFVPRLDGVRTDDGALPLPKMLIPSFR